MTKPHLMGALVALGLLVGAPGALAGAKCAGTGTPPTVSGVTYGTPGGYVLKADVFEPAGAGPFKTVLLVHGGSWRFGCRQDNWPEARALVANGMVAVTIDMREVKKGFTAPAATDDAASAIIWLKAHASTYKVNPTHIAGMGFSSGGQIVGVLAGNGDVTAMASLSGDVDFGEACRARLSSKNCATEAAYIGCSLASCPSAWNAQSPVKLVSAAFPPAFFSQGTNDPLVDYAEAVTLDQTLTNAHVTHEFCSLQTGVHAQETETFICPESGNTVLATALAFLTAHA